MATRWMQKSEADDTWYYFDDREGYQEEAG